MVPALGRALLQARLSPALQDTASPRGSDNVGPCNLHQGIVSRCKLQLVSGHIELLVSRGQCARRNAPTLVGTMTLTTRKRKGCYVTMGGREEERHLVSLGAPSSIVMAGEYVQLPGWRSPRSDSQGWGLGPATGWVPESQVVAKGAVGGQWRGPCRPQLYSEPLLPSFPGQTLLCSPAAAVPNTWGDCARCRDGPPGPPAWQDLMDSVW